MDICWLFAGRWHIGFVRLTANSVIRGVAHRLHPGILYWQHEHGQFRTAAITAPAGTDHLVPAGAQPFCTPPPPLATNPPLKKYI
jgi:hypothetical protein